MRTRRDTTGLLALTAAAAALLPAVHGGISGRAVWNGIPLFAALLPLLILQALHQIRYAVFLFSYTIATVVLLLHLGHLANAGAFALLAWWPPRGAFSPAPLAIGAGYAVSMAGVLVAEVRDAVRSRREGGMPPAP